MKIVFSVLLTLLLVPTVPVYAEVNENYLTEDEIVKRMEHIADSYELYEPLSEEDAKFIAQYANQSVQNHEIGIQGSTTVPFDKTKYNSGRTVGLWIKGTIWAKIGVINNSYGGKYNSYVVKGSSRAYKITNTIRHTAYGLVGSGGVGKVYDGSIKNTCNKSGIVSCSTDSSKAYTASVAYASTWATSTVWYDNGSTLTVNSY